MNLCLDIGNTRVKVGVFDGARMLHQTHWPAWTQEGIQALLQRYALRRAIVSCVASPDPALLPFLKGIGLNVIELNAKTGLPFTNGYTTPDTLGKDRLAAVAGAHALYPQRNVLVIDAGTCIKYDCLDANAVFHGGNIAPGLHMRIRAMHEQTARLPLVPLAMPETYIGYSTETALQNGALLGAVLEAQGFVALFRQQWPGLLVLLTGGDAEFLRPRLEQPDLRVEPDLLLIGLNHLLNHNL
ncbi:MAG: type III pantothenate kinase [Saprospiraceae bacterium]|nr:type III pantothenate kinase [Saprospiraceae bacterium]